MFVPTKDLPPVVRNVLEGVGFHRTDIDVQPATEAELDSPYGDGYQTFAVAVDILGGRISHEVVSSWGGANMYERRTLDRGGKMELPEGAMLVMGQRGGGRPVSAKLYAHPGLMAPLLPSSAGAELTIEELAVLALFVALKPFAREDEARRYELPFRSAVTHLLELGLLKQNKAGATQITTAGKNLITKSARQAIVSAGYRFLNVY